MGKSGAELHLGTKVEGVASQKTAREGSWQGRDMWADSQGSRAQEADWESFPQLYLRDAPGKWVPATVKIITEIGNASTRGF